MFSWYFFIGWAKAWNGLVKVSIQWDPTPAEYWLEDEKCIKYVYRLNLTNVVIIFSCRHYLNWIKVLTFVDLENFVLAISFHTTIFIKGIGRVIMGKRWWFTIENVIRTNVQHRSVYTFWNDSLCKRAIELLSRTLDYLTFIFHENKSDQNLLIICARFPAASTFRRWDASGCFSTYLVEKYLNEIILFNMICM